MPLGKGLYETLITEALALELREISDDYVVERERLSSAEAADRIALHMNRVIRRVVADLDEEDRARVGLGLARELVALIFEGGDSAHALPIEDAEFLRAIVGKLPNGASERVASPLTPLLDTALITNSPGEPRIGAQILSEIESADRIDVVMAFIRRSGIGPLLDSLRGHREAGKPLRVLTTTYTDSTERRALDQLVDLGAEVRISYDLSTTRLHAKAWVFHRHSGFSTAYVGSSNLTLCCPGS